MHYHPDDQTLALAPLCQLQKTHENSVLSAGGLTGFLPLCGKASLGTWIHWIGRCHLAQIVNSYKISILPVIVNIWL